MRCYQHNEREAVGTCTSCGAGGCPECLVHYEGAKACSACAQRVYQWRLWTIRSEAASARRKLIVAAVIFGFFFATSLLFTGSVALAFWSGYGWCSAYLAVMPFVRAIGSRLSGGAISTSATGALFGTISFWFVAGWWLVLLGCVYAYLGGGIYHLVRLIQRWRGAEQLAQSIPAPAGAYGVSSVPGALMLGPGGGGAPDARPPSLGFLGTGRSPALLSAAVAVVLLGYCSVQSVTELGNGCSPGVPIAEREASRPAPARLASPSPPTPFSPAALQEPAPRPVRDTRRPNQGAIGEDAVEGLIGRYYSDLNANTFDANRYFEPSVERYITMINTSTAAMNRYIHQVFPKQFQQHHFELETGSLSADGPLQWVFVERSSYYQVAKRRNLDQRVQVRIRLSPAGKMVFFHQFKVLPKDGVAPTKL